MRFPIHPTEHVLIGDNNAIQEISMNNNDSNPYEDCLPTEPNPDRTQIVYDETLEEMYDGEHPYQHLVDARKEADEGEVVLADGSIVSPDESDCDGGESR